MEDLSSQERQRDFLTEAQRKRMTLHKERGLERRNARLRHLGQAHLTTPPTVQEDGIVEGSLQLRCQNRGPFSLTSEQRGCLANWKEISLPKYEKWHQQEVCHHHPHSHFLHSSYSQPSLPQSIVDLPADVLAGSEARSGLSVSQGPASAGGAPSSIGVSDGCKKDKGHKADIPMYCLHKGDATDVLGAVGRTRGDIIELSDDDGGTANVVVVELSEDDLLEKRDIIDLSSQEASSSACFGRSCHENHYAEARAEGQEEVASTDELCPLEVHTASVLSVMEQDVINDPVEQHGPKGELVGSTAGIVYYRRQCLDARDEKRQIKSQEEMANSANDRSCPMSVHATSAISEVEQDMAIEQHGSKGELVRSTTGILYYRMGSLGGEYEERENIYSVKSVQKEVQDDTFVPLRVLPPSLSKQQQSVLRAVLAGKSIFMTGAAGTGKSFLLGFVIDILKGKLGRHSVFVTASTGLAACALGGTTIHSFAGIGLGQEKPDVLANKVLGSREATSRWRNTGALILDEVSMIDGELFDKLDYVARVVRADLLADEPLSKSFGGIQLIVTGDFFQLPPVKPANPRKFFAFEADCWKRCFDQQIELKQIFRQDDEKFAGLLNKIRKGTYMPETLFPLQNCYKELPDDGSGIKATRLYPLKQDVNQENISTMRMLNREISEFSALDWASSRYHQSMLQHMRAGKMLPLCIGAQVMLVKNIDTSSGLVNGARGVVIGYSSQSVMHDKDLDVSRATAAVSPNGEWPVVQFLCDGSQRVIGPHKESIEDGGREVASRIQVPLILAWALSIHKCQGMTLDRVKMDLSRAFGFGMVYVALSRVKNLNGLQLTGFNPSLIRVHGRVVEFYERLECNQD